MSKNVENVILGSGDLYVNNVLAGHLDGPVELEMTKELFEVKPNGYKNPLKIFIISQESILRAPVAEFKTSMLKYALGVTNSIENSTFSGSVFSGPSYGDNSTSFSVPDGSYETLTFGGEKNTDVYPIRFEVEKPDGEYFIVVFYKVANIGDLALSFEDEEETINNLELKGLAVEGRDEGDRVGTFLHQIGDAS